MSAAQHDRFARPASPPGRVRVLVGAPSAREQPLAALLHGDPAIVVAGWVDDESSDESSVVHAAARLKPDVVLLDLHVPAVDVLQATRRLMAEAPTPIVVLSADPLQADGAHAAAVLAAGALAVVPRPRQGEAGAAMGAKLLNTLKSMAQVRVVRRRGTGPLASPAPSGSGSAAGTPRLELVAIGASTGGPQALQEILTRLPAAFAPPVVVVQHIAPTFAAGLVEWLKPQCALPLVLARYGMALGQPGIYLAPTGYHLVVRGRALALSDEPPLRGHRPSATVLFRSVAVAYGPRAVGVLLTGMGDDGAAGLHDLKMAGGTTIAQDEESSVVFGMPAAAIALGAADHVLAPAEIAPLLIDLAQSTARG
jgi:two-component system chemotaxis response regulator CheB